LKITACNFYIYKSYNILFSDYYDFVFFLYLLLIQKPIQNMARLTSTETNDDLEENDSILTADIAALTLDNRISEPTTTLIVDSIPTDISSLSSDNSAQNQNHHHETDVIRAFNDPALAIQRSKNTNEKWLLDFDSPKSAPQGAYSVLSQAVKKLVSERTACRFGKYIRLITISREIEFRLSRC
jgi:hypothetical protein